MKIGQFRIRVEFAEPTVGVSRYTLRHSIGGPSAHRAPPARPFLRTGNPSQFLLEWDHPRVFSGFRRLHSPEGASSKAIGGLNHVHSSYVVDESFVG